MDSALEKAQVTQTDDVLNNGAEIDLNDPQKLSGDIASNLKLDKHGLPLVPQPTQHSDDPLVSLNLQKNLDPVLTFSRTGRQHSSFSSLFKSAGYVFSIP